LYSPNKWVIVIHIKKFLNIEVFFRWKMVKNDQKKTAFLEKNNWPSLAFFYKKMSWLSKEMTPSATDILLRIFSKNNFFQNSVPNDKNRWFKKTVVNLIDSWEMVIARSVHIRKLNWYLTIKSLILLDFSWRIKKITHKKFWIWFAEMFIIFWKKSTKNDK
jgi:hypothetical protein